MSGRLSQLNSRAQKYERVLHFLKMVVSVETADCWGEFFYLAKEEVSKQISLFWDLLVSCWHHRAQKLCHVWDFETCLLVFFIIFIKVIVIFSRSSLVFIFNILARMNFDINPKNLRIHLLTWSCTWPHSLLECWQEVNGAWDWNDCKVVVWALLVAKKYCIMSRYLVSFHETNRIPFNFRINLNSVFNFGEVDLIENLGASFKSKQPIDLHIKHLQMFLQFFEVSWLDLVEYRHQPFKHVLWNWNFKLMILNFGE